MIISNNTSAGDFNWHFRNLFNEKRHVRMIGCRPKNNNGTDDEQPGRVYDGLDAQEAYNLARIWNSEGYNIYFKILNTKNCMECKWIALRVYVDTRLIGNVPAMERIMKMNDEEFLGAANILDTGDGFWFFMRLPNHPFETVHESVRFLHSIHDYCTNLGIVWDVSTNDDLAFYIDAIDFFPISKMPAAGTLNHKMNPPYLTNWYCYREENSLPGIIERVMESTDLLKRIYNLDQTVEGPEIMRKAMLIEFNQNFTPDSLIRLIAKNDYVRKLVSGNHLIAIKGNKRWENIDLILFLRAHFLANYNVIDRGVAERSKGLPVSFSNLHKDEKIDNVRTILAVDRHLKLRANTRNGRPIDLPIETSNNLDCLTSLPSFEIICRETVIKELSAKYGAQIHFARAGWYLLFDENTPQDVLHLRDDSFHHHSYVPFPCHFWIAASQIAHGKGALLVPNSIVNHYWKELNRSEVKSHPTVIYFWHYGNKFCLERAPAELTEESSDKVERLETWASKNRPAMWRIWKSHCLDRERRV